MINEKIRELRIDHNLSQLDLANKIESNQRQISKWENGVIEPNIESLVKLADYFEVTTDYLLGRSNDVGVILTNANLTEYQRTLLAVVNQLPHDDQFQVLGFAQALAQR